MGPVLPTIDGPQRVDPHIPGHMRGPRQISPAAAAISVWLVPIEIGKTSNTNSSSDGVHPGERRAVRPASRQLRTGRAARRCGAHLNSETRWEVSIHRGPGTVKL